MFALVDLLNRKWWRLVGRPVDLAGAQSWLAAPMSSSSSVAAGWLDAQAAAFGGSVLRDVPAAGLMASLDDLDGCGGQPWCACTTSSNGSTGERRG